MKKEELMKYAEQGVREELSQMQAKINELARLFPHIVCNQDGTIPAVVPVQVKSVKRPAGKTRPNGHAPATTPRLATARVEHIRKFLDAHPGATTKEISDAVGLFPTYVLKLVRVVATPTERRKAGLGNPIKWRLKATK